MLCKSMFHKSALCRHISTEQTGYLNYRMRNHWLLKNYNFVCNRTLVHLNLNFAAGLAVPWNNTGCKWTRTFCHRCLEKVISCFVILCVWNMTLQWWADSLNLLMITQFTLDNRNFTSWKLLGVPIERWATDHENYLKIFLPCTIFLSHIFFGISSHIFSLLMCCPQSKLFCVIQPGLDMHSVQVAQCVMEILMFRHS